MAEIAMEGRVRGQFRVEDGDQGLGILGGGTIVIQGQQGTDIPPEPDDLGGTDENQRERIFTYHGDPGLALEAIQLTAEGVSPDVDIHERQISRFPIDSFGHENSPRAGAPDFETGGESFTDGLTQSILVQQSGKAATFPSGYDEPGEIIEIRNLPYPYRPDTKPFQMGQVLDHAPLEIQDADMRHSRKGATSPAPLAPVPWGWWESRYRPWPRPDPWKLPIPFPGPGNER